MRNEVFFIGGVKPQIFIGPSGSGKSKRANEIAEEFKSRKQVVTKLDGRYKHWGRLKYTFGHVDPETQLLIIDDVQKVNFFDYLMLPVTNGIMVSHKNEPMQIIRPRLIVTCDEGLTADLLVSQGPSFNRRFEIIQFPVKSNQMNLFEINKPVAPDEILGKRWEFLKARLKQYVDRTRMSWLDFETYKNSVPDEEFQAEVDRVVDPEFHSSNYPDKNLLNFKK